MSPLSPLPFRLTLSVISALLMSLLSGPLWAGGTIAGAVHYQGIPPLPKTVPITIDSELCGKKSVSQELIVGKKGGIQNAVVFLHGPVIGAKPFSPPLGGFLVDQKRCQFEPHVLIMAPGPLAVFNSDEILHNFHTLGRRNLEINKTQPGSMNRMSLKFEIPEILEVRCDVHPWMQAWLVIAEHAYYAVTDEEGHFQLTDIPAGDYTLNLWHESLGTGSRRVHVTEGQETRVEFRLTRP